MRRSVSVIFSTRDKIFYITRQNYLKDFPGYSSFPGGKVEKGEDLMDALKREVQEEVGLDISNLQKQGIVLSITKVGFAATPDFNPSRFENYFFKVLLDKEVELTLDENEVASGAWVKPEEFLSLYHDGGLLLVPPIVNIVSKLNSDLPLESKEDTNFDLGLNYDGERFVPMIESIYGVKQFLPRSNTLPPANRTNCFLIGDHQQGSYIIDPSPMDNNEYKKLTATLSNHNFSAIFLTHHHMDHHQHAPKLAREFNVPIHLSSDTHKRIVQKWGKDYFDKIKIVERKDGEVLTTSLGVDVLIHSVPGHDRGQLALVTRNGSWALVGDLIQTVGTVVIAEPEGDMAEYFSSLEYMISLHPKFILPSHGIAVGGVKRLEETLIHRKHRETQIKELLNDGKEIQEILEIIYKDVDPQLHPLAIKTITSHIKKINQEA